jgi:hypothetical protein
LKRVECEKKVNFQDLTPKFFPAKNARMKIIWTKHAEDRQKEWEKKLEVSIPRQSRGLYDCWPLKGA